MTLRVWLNRTFATNYHVVTMLKDNPDQMPVQVLGSHVDPASPVLTVCDETFPEPVHLDGDAYVEYALDFCRTHAVDVFWPTWQQEAVAAAAGRFAEAGVTVMTSPAEAIALFEDKAATYRAAREIGVPVPAFETVTTVTEFVTAYERLKDAGHTQVCFKPVRGVGAQGFRILADGPRSFATLEAKVGDFLGYEEAVALLSLRERFDPLMVMPVLSGGEVSVDTLSLDGKVLSAVPRFKRSGSRVIELLDAPHLVEETAKFVEAWSLSYLSNVQFRFDEDGNHYLLEVNTRASGGLFQSCLAGGNLPWYAVQVARHGMVEVPQPTVPVRLTTFATAVAVG